MNTKIIADDEVQSALLSRPTAEAPDALLNIITQFAADGRRDKMDLGVGVYRDAGGDTPIMRAVKHAEACILAN